MRWKVCERLRPSGADDHAHGERGAILMGTQRAQIVGNTLRQHWHNAVREIDRIAAHQGLAVKRRAGRHIVRDVGDGDRDDEAALIGRVFIRLGMNRVVVVLGVGRIDGDQRQLPPILAVRHRRRLGGFRLAQGIAAEHARNIVGVDSDQADGLLAGQRAERFSTTRPCGRPKRDGRDVSTRDQIAFLRTVGGAFRNGEFLAEHLLVDRLEPAAAIRVLYERRRGCAASADR